MTDTAAQPDPARLHPPPLEQALEWAVDRTHARRLQALRWQVFTGWVTDWPKERAR